MLSWDRLGAASGVIGVLLALAGLVATGGGSPNNRPATNAATDQVVTYMSRSATATSSLGYALVLTGFLFLLLFVFRLRGIMKNAEGEGSWLASAGAGGFVFYLLADSARFVFSDARNLATGHHLAPAEAVTFFDVSNALTPLAWVGIAMFMIPMSAAALRSRTLPAWLGWSGLVIGVGNLLWAWLPTGGTSTPAEDFFILWLVVTSVILVRRSLARTAR
jgi:hypothetical protein